MNKYKFNFFQKEWLKALKSGKYQKGKCKLAKIQNNVTKYCCLGVACEVFNDKIASNLKVKKLKKLEDNRFSNRIFTYDGDCDYLPNRVYKKLKLNDCEGDFGESTLVSLNDSDETHKEIAQFIENNPEKVFIK
jgi:hypothetical protein